MKNSFIRINILSVLITGAAIITSAVAQTYLMPTNSGGTQPFDPNPAASNSPTSQVLTYGVDADANTIPLKSIQITNNRKYIVYPIIRGQNSNRLAAPADTNTGLYDPYDPVNQEYRGYIGYRETNGKYYFGLKPGQSITIRVPLVFWDSGRLGIETSGDYLLATKAPNPLNYDPNAKRSIAPSETNNAHSITNGVVMWYHAGIAQSPAIDSLDQLTEATFRDHDYLTNSQITLKTSNQIPDNQLVTLINYDVSNVDTLFLPVSMEALDVWVIPQAAGKGANPNRDGWTKGSHPDCFGWTGATNADGFVQGKIALFTASNNTLLGDYFPGKRGWPFFNGPNPKDTTLPRKIPSGATIYPNSPLLNVASSYNNPTNWSTDNRYMLSSGGSDPSFVGIGCAGAGGTNGGTNGSLILPLAPGEDPKKLEFVQKGDIVHVILALPATNSPVQSNTTVVSKDLKAKTVQLSKPLVGASAGGTATFSRPVDDYCVDAQSRLWFSWAQYYLAHWRDNNTNTPTAAVSIQGSIEAQSAAIVFNEAHPELVKGMAITGPGLDNAMTEVGIHQGNALILEIASDSKSVVVSQVAHDSHTNEAYSFSPPQSLLWTPVKQGDPGYPLFGNSLKFATNTPAWHNPYEFSQKVYMIMASMNQIGQPNNNTLLKFMEDVVGANMGYIFDQAGKDSGDGQAVIAIIRDMVKSVLRGVTDFTEYPDSLDAYGNHLHWYPDPKVPTGGQKFNVFNLDPYVRFVHVNLGFSGYGFSVDDDTADVGAGGANNLQIAVTGYKGLTNTNVWAITAPYGPIRNVSASYSGDTNATNGDTLYNGIQSVIDKTPITIVTAGKNNLNEGDTVVIDQVVGDTAANGTFKISNVTDTSFDLYDPVTGTNPIASNGTYTNAPTSGRWSYPLHPYIDTGADLTKVFYRVQGDDALGTFLGTPVYVNSVAGKTALVKVSTKKGENIRIWQLGVTDSGRLLLNTPILKADGTPLPAGTYNFTFGGTGR
jgi:hypothetical protein